MKIVTAAQMRSLDRRIIGEAGVSGSTLMERAGTGAALVLDQVFAPLSGKAVTILCGKGNNGGDGFVVARMLARRRANVAVILFGPPTDLSPDARLMYRRFIRVSGTRAVHINPNHDQLRNRLAHSALIVDALLGTGLSSTVSGTYQVAIDQLNQLNRPVLSLDLPSGLHADSGSVMGSAVKASWTVTFGLPKLGLYVSQGIDHAGEIHITDIGIPESFIKEIVSPIELVTREQVQRLLPNRPRSAHKGTFGHAGLIAGSVGKTGSAAMAARAVLKVGAGLVTVATPSSLNDVLEAKLLEAMTVPMPETKARTFARSGLDRLVSFANSRHAIAVGPGLTTHHETVELTQALIPRLEKPTVLDADALNALAGRVSLLSELKAPLIITPHPGEMARLEEHSTPQTVNADRVGTALRFAQARRVIVVLKGARTIIAHPDGSIALIPTGNPGMATAGTGDALTGIITGLLAQGLAPWDAARVGTYVHGLAGDLAAKELGYAGMTAGDLIDQIPHALKGISNSHC